MSMGSLQKRVAELEAELQKKNDELATSRSLCSLLHQQNEQLYQLFCGKQSDVLLSSSSLPTASACSTPTVELSQPVKPVAATGSAPAAEPSIVVTEPAIEYSAPVAELSTAVTEKAITHGSALATEPSTTESDDEEDDEDIDPEILQFFKPVDSSTLQPPSHAEMMGHMTKEMPIHSTDTRPSKVSKLRWAETKIKADNDVLVLSDSLLKCMDPLFSKRRADIFSFSGMRSHEMLEVVKSFDHGIQANTLVICVGTNDYYRCSLSLIKEDLKELIEVGKKISPEIILCTIPASLWKPRRPLPKSQEEVQSARRDLNFFIRGMKSQGVDILDLEDLFRHHWRRNSKSGWYQADTVHPNTSGIIAIEMCLRDKLEGRRMKPPRDISFTAKEVERRRRLSITNYSKTTIYGLQQSSKKRNLVEDLSSDEEPSPVWKRQK